VAIALTTTNHFIEPISCNGGERSCIIRDTAAKSAGA
jgi:hypothetical protein